MLDWKKTMHEVGSRIKEFAASSPDTIRAVGMLGGAGAKTNHLDAKTRELISLAVAVTTRCDGCIAFHSAEAVKLGITKDEMAEALAAC